MDPYKLLHGMPTREVEEELGDLPGNAYLSDFSSRFAWGVVIPMFAYLLLVMMHLDIMSGYKVCKLYIGT